MPSSLAELLSGLPGVDLAREFLDLVDKKRAAVQLAVRELAANETKEEIPGQPYLSLSSLRSLRRLIAEGWEELHGDTVEQYLNRPELGRVDSDKLFGELAMLFVRDADREWSEVTSGKFTEGHPDFDVNGNVRRRLIAPGQATDMPIEFGEQIVKTTESAKMRALKLKLDPDPAGSALTSAKTVEPIAAETPASVDHGHESNVAAMADYQGTDSRGERASRQALLDAYKAECSRAGKKVTDLMIAKAVNPAWSHRSHVHKWVRGEYTGTRDRLFREVFIKKPHLS